MKPNRTWVYAPSRDVLAARWSRLVGETDRTRKAELFKETSSSALDKVPPPLPGDDVHAAASRFDVERSAAPPALRVGYRSFDRQWVTPDSRLMHRPSPDLWAARVPGQVFLVEQHSKVLRAGSPGIVATALIPDMDHFKGSEGGRVLPVLHADGSGNTAPGLLDGLRRSLHREEITALDLAAYVAALVAHPGYTATFADELTTPGVRVPITAFADAWDRAVALGREVLWCHTYAETAVDPGAGRPAGTVRYPAGDARQPRALTPVGAMPREIAFTAGTDDPTVGTVRVGTGSFGPVRASVWDYAVGGRNVVGSWFGYRRAEPAGRRSSPLDDINATTWSADWTRELIDLLTVLTRLTDLEDAEAALLADVLAGALLSREDLAAAGARWPSRAADRRPRRAVDLSSFDVDPPVTGSHVTLRPPPSASPTTVPAW